MSTVSTFFSLPALKPSIEFNKSFLSPDALGGNAPAGGGGGGPGAGGGGGGMMCEFLKVYKFFERGGPGYNEFVGASIELVE